MAPRRSSRGSSPGCLDPAELECPPRFATRRNADRETLGTKVGQVAAALGEPFMPWQQYVADVAYEIDPATGLLVYGEVGLTVPRQQGKTTLTKAVATHRAVGMATPEWGGPQLIRYAAQTRNDAREKMVEEVWPALEASPFASLFTKRLQNGAEHLKWSNGSRWGLSANTKKSGHGGSPDLVFLDEAFAHVDNRMEQAYRPAMMTKTAPQLWVLSTAGDAESVYLWGKVQSGRALAENGVQAGRCYFEWSAVPGSPRGDPATWLATMPAIGHTVTIERIAADYAGMDPDEFDRAYLNLWSESAGESAISEELWAGCRDPQSQATYPIALGIDARPDMSAAAIAICSRERSGALHHVEVIDHREGTDWVVDRIFQLRARHQVSGVALDPSGPAGAFIGDLVARNVPLKLATMTQHAQACGAFLNDVVNRKLRHTGQPSLDAAVAGATKRHKGDVWLFDRKGPADICPLVAAGLARWAHVQAPTPISFRYGLDPEPMTPEEVAG